MGVDGRECGGIARARRRLEALSSVEINLICKRSQIGKRLRSEHATAPREVGTRAWSLNVEPQQSGTVMRWSYVVHLCLGEMRAGS